jgi:hypothetical protein
LSEEESTLLTKAFNNNLIKAKNNHWNPEPTFQDVIRVAEQINEGRSSQKIEPFSLFPDENTIDWDSMLTNKLKNFSDSYCTFLALKN